MGNAAPVGGVKRLSQIAADSVTPTPRPTDCSSVPSSSTRVIGSLGRVAGCATVVLPLAGAAARNFLLSADPLISADLPVSPPITMRNGGQVGVRVGVSEGVRVRVGELVTVGVTVEVGGQ